MRSFPFILIIVIFFSACEKDISVNLQQQEPQLVVEGQFENDAFPFVVLSHSLDYFSKIDPAVLLNSFVHGATVSVSDGNRTMALKEQVININGAKLYVYLPDTSQMANAFRGKAGLKYKLNINADNKSYESMTTIPLVALKLDSMWAQRVKVKSDTNKARLWVRITDSPEPGNYARYLTRRNSELFLPGLNSVVDDQIVNGTTFEIPVDAGVDRNKPIDLESVGYFNRGDTVTLKFSNIDKATYDFWRTIDFAYNSNGNPFASPIKILGNVPGALGYWGGYAVTYRTIIISK
ncbi:DUF4249 domain-containing protein [Chitinophaga sp. MM2321]|uniref:DUF4249 domain-containing protein n=1 Tax=Chitinophaga sp. MM2321 TaxID=3137178 RepID=UPI0032D58F01